MRHGRDGPISFCHHHKCQTGLSAFHVIWECVSYIGYGVFRSVVKNQFVLQPLMCNVYLLAGQQVNIAGTPLQYRGSPTYGVFTIVSVVLFVSILKNLTQFQLFILTNKKVLSKKKCSILVIDTLKCKISDFLNSNTCFCL